jgi:DNA polymerase-1
MLKNPELLIIDGTAMLFGAYFSKHKFQAPNGLEIGGVVLFAQRIQKILSRQSPDRIALVFDAGHRTFRHQITTDYKGHRERPPDDLRPQFDIVRAVAVQLGLACFCVRGFEADDLMATLSTHGRQLGFRCRMYSSDKDLYQLIEDGSDGQPPVIQEIPRTRERIDAAGVIKRTGVRTDQIVDFMALVGDACDNISGVRGIGPKTAAALLQHFDTLDNIFENLDEVSTIPIRGAKTVQTKLENGRDEAIKARSLVELIRDVEVGIPPETILKVTQWSGPRGESADHLFQHLGFSEPLLRLRQHAHWLSRRRQPTPQHALA